MERTLCGGDELSVGAGQPLATAAACGLRDAAVRPAISHLTGIDPWERDPLSENTDGDAFAALYTATLSSGNQLTVRSGANPLPDPMTSSRWRQGE